METEQKQSRQPTHLIWQVVGEGETGRWMRCGAAWANKDGKGFNLKFDAFPLSGRIVIRENARGIEANAEAEAAAEAAGGTEGQQ